MTKMSNLEKGLLKAFSSNPVRNIHMINAILDMVEDGKRVFITMGPSHAFRIENALRGEMIED